MCVYIYIYIWLLFHVCVDLFILWFCICYIFIIAITIGRPRPPCTAPCSAPACPSAWCPRPPEEQKYVCNLCVDDACVYMYTYVYIYIYIYIMLWLIHIMYVYYIYIYIYIYTYIRRWRASRTGPRAWPGTCCGWARSSYIIGTIYHITGIMLYHVIAW